MNNAPEPRNAVPINTVVKCDICKKDAAEWISTWSKGEPHFTPWIKTAKYPDSVTKYCDTCKDISATRFRP